MFGGSKIASSKRSMQTRTQKEIDLKSRFEKTSSSLSAIEWLQKASRLWKNGRYDDPQKALDHLNRHTENVPRNATSTGLVLFGAAVIPLCSGSHAR